MMQYTSTFYKWKCPCGLFDIDPETMHTLSVSPCRQYKYVCKMCWPCRLSNREVKFRPGFEPQTPQLEMRFTIRCGVCSMCLTLLVSSESAGGGLGCARVVCLRGVLFSFFGRIIQIIYSYVYIYNINIIMACNRLRQRVVRRQLVLLESMRQEVRFPECLPPFFWGVPFFFISCFQEPCVVSQQGTWT